MDKPFVASWPILEYIVADLEQNYRFLPIWGGEWMGMERGNRGRVRRQGAYGEGGRLDCRAGGERFFRGGHGGSGGCCDGLLGSPSCVATA